MNRSIIRLVTGRILLVLGVLMLFPLSISYWYQEPGNVQKAYLMAIALSEALGLLMSIKKPSSTHF